MFDFDLGGDMREGRREERGERFGSSYHSDRNFNP